MHEARKGDFLRQPASPRGRGCPGPDPERGRRTHGWEERVLPYSAKPNGNPKERRDRENWVVLSIFNFS